MLSFLLLPLLAYLPDATPAPRTISLRLNGAAVPADTLESRFEVAGKGRVLTLNILRRDSPDEPGLSILLDEFKNAPGVYRFKDVLSGHVRQATYRAGGVVAESLVCSPSDGEVRVTAVDAATHTITGSYRVVLCAVSGRKRMVFEGHFSYPYEVR